MQEALFDILFIYTFCFYYYYGSNKNLELYYHTIYMSIPQFTNYTSNITFLE